MSSPPPPFDEATALCLTCSASIHPSLVRRYKQKRTDHMVKAEDTLFFTNCCKRPICPSCIATNARLRHYDPCLHCLAGISVVSGANNTFRDASVSRDQDIFVLGDDEDTQELIDPPSYEEATECTTTNTTKNAERDEDPEIHRKPALQEESDLTHAS